MKVSLMRKLHRNNFNKEQGMDKLLEEAKDLYAKKPQLVKFGGIVVVMLVLSLLFGG